MNSTKYFHGDDLGEMDLTNQLNMTTGTASSGKYNTSYAPSSLSKLHTSHNAALGSSLYAGWDTTETKVYGPDDSGWEIGDRTRHFANDNTGGMDFTLCVGGLGTNTTDCKRSPADSTHIFSTDGDMELTQCVPSNDVPVSKPAAYNVSQFAPEYMCSPVAKVQARSFINKLQGINDNMIIFQKGPSKLFSVDSTKQELFHKESPPVKVDALSFLARLQGNSSPDQDPFEDSDKPQFTAERMRTVSSSSDNMELTKTIGTSGDATCRQPMEMDLTNVMNTTRCPSVNKTRIYSEDMGMMDFTTCNGIIDVCATNPPDISVNMATNTTSADMEITGEYQHGNGSPHNSPTGDSFIKSQRPKSHRTLALSDKTIHFSEEQVTCKMEMTFCVSNEIVAGEAVRPSPLHSELVQTPISNKTVHFRDSPGTGEMVFTTCCKKSICLEDTEQAKSENKYVLPGRNSSLSSQAHLSLSPNKTINFKTSLASGDMELTTCAPTELESSQTASSEQKKTVCGENEFKNITSTTGVLEYDSTKNKVEEKDTILQGEDDCFSCKNSDIPITSASGTAHTKSDSIRTGFSGKSVMSRSFSHDSSAHHAGTMLKRSSQSMIEPPIPSKKSMLQSEHYSLNSEKLLFDLRPNTLHTNTPTDDEIPTKQATIASDAHTTFAPSNQVENVCGEVGLPVAVYDDSKIKLSDGICFPDVTDKNTVSCPNSTQVNEGDINTISGTNQVFDCHSIQSDGLTVNKGSIESAFVPSSSNTPEHELETKSATEVPVNQPEDFVTSAVDDSAQHVLKRKVTMSGTLNYSRKDRNPFEETLDGPDILHHNLTRSISYVTNKSVSLLDLSRCNMSLLSKPSIGSNVS